jgi:hypothetical protein
MVVIPGPFRRLSESIVSPKLGMVKANRPRHDGALYFYGTTASKR